MNQYENIAKVLEYVFESNQEQADLNNLSSFTQLSSDKIQEIFREWGGVSFYEFINLLSKTSIKQVLNNENTLFENLNLKLDSKNNISHDMVMQIVPMSLDEYKNEGENLTIHYSFQKSVFGEYMLASTDLGICSLNYNENLDKTLNELNEIWKNAKFIKEMDLEQEKMVRFMNGENLSDQIKLHIKGTDFQIKIWETLLKIPKTKLVTYSQLGKDLNLANPTKAARAIGTAIGSNPIAYAIPCHRVIQNTGIIGEYRWSRIRKLAMIGYEASHCLKSSID